MRLTNIHHQCHVQWTLSPKFTSSALCTQQTTQSSSTNLFIALRTESFWKDCVYWAWKDSVLCKLYSCCVILCCVSSWEVGLTLLRVHGPGSWALCSSSSGACRSGLDVSPPASKPALSAQHWPHSPRPEGRTSISTEDRRSCSARSLRETG